MISKLLRMGMDPTLSAPNSLNGSPLDLTKKDTSAVGKKIYELLTRALTAAGIASRWCCSAHSLACVMELNRTSD
jgi:hypothetical protein